MMTRSPGTAFFAIGSYTEPYGPFRAVGEGLSLLALDPSGRLQRLDCLALPNPSYALPIGRGRLAVVLETDDERAGIALVRVTGERLRLEQRLAAPGRIPCHLDLHPAGTWLAGACYGTGEVFAMPIDADGRLAGERVIATRHRGASVHPLRQTMPHPHATRFSPDGRWLLVPDLGTDRVVSYRFDSGSGPDFSSAEVWTAPPGSGPRLALFSADGRHLLLVEEIGCALVSLGWDDGRLAEIDRASSLIAPFTGDNTAAGLCWHPSGQVIGVTNRGADSVALFRFDSGTGRLLPWRELSSGGAKPRAFSFSPCGRWLLAANQNGDSIVLYAIDIDRDRLEDTGERLALRSPSCLSPLP